MAGRPAGYSDEENDSEDYNYYENTSYNHNEDLQASAVAETPKDPWAAAVFEAAKDHQTNILSGETGNLLETASVNEYNIQSTSSFLKCLEEGNIDALKKVWLNKSNLGDVGVDNQSKK